MLTYDEKQSPATETDQSAESGTHRGRPAMGDMAWRQNAELYGNILSLAKIAEETLDLAISRQSNPMPVGAPAARLFERALDTIREIGALAGEVGLEQ